jgi:hypothetical protein
VRTLVVSATVSGVQTFNPLTRRAGDFGRQAIESGHFAQNKSRVSENWTIKDLTSRVWCGMLLKPNDRHVLVTFGKFWGILGCENRWKHLL